MENYCVCCGEVIPEGRMVCPLCEYALTKVPPGDYSKRSFMEKIKEIKKNINT